MVSYNDIYIKTRNKLKNLGVEACSQEARMIVAKAAGKTVQELLKDIQLYTIPEIAERADALVERRASGEPVAYILGEWEFYGVSLTITPDVLIPRPDTEILIDAAKEILIGNNMNARVLDLCCGSGCIACSMAKEMPATKIVAADISNSVLDVCRKNISDNRFSSRIICMQADATVTPPCGIGTFDMIICNPPYIPSEEILTLDDSVKNFEPMWALDGGQDGLKFYKQIIKYWKSIIRSGGSLLFEVGEGQAKSVKEMLLAAGFKSASIKKDHSGTERVVIGTY